MCRSGRTLLRTLQALIAAAGFGSCGSGPPSHPPLNVLIVTLDTTRADALGTYGGRAVTPTFDHLADSGVVFEQASSVAPLTLPAHSSVFTGLFPPGHGIHGNGQRRLGPACVTLAQRLRGRGFRTGAFVSSVVLDHQWGLDQGFDVYRDLGVHTGSPGDRESLRRPADQVVDDAVSWLRQDAGAPFFAWLHLYDAHAPSHPPAAFAAPDSGNDYLGAVSFIDFQIARVISFLDDRQLIDRTIIVIVGDHGESLGEHGEDTHGLFVYQAVLHVPLIIRAPVATMHGRRVSDPVRLVDIMPTVLDLLHQPPAPAIDGQTLVPLMNGERRALGLESYAESQYALDRFGWSPLYALREGRFKLIVAPRPELYDLDTDPQETTNLYPQRMTLAVAMTRRLRDLSAAADRHTTAAERIAVDDDTRARLAALGYVGTTAPRARRDADTRLADPKDRVELYRRLTRSARRSSGALP